MTHKVRGNRSKSQSINPLGLHRYESNTYRTNHTVHTFGVISHKSTNDRPRCCYYLILPAVIHGYQLRIVFRQAGVLADVVGFRQAGLHDGSLDGHPELPYQRPNYSPGDMTVRYIRYIRYMRYDIQGDINLVLIAIRDTVLCVYKYFEVCIMYVWSSTYSQG